MGSLLTIALGILGAIIGKLVADDLMEILPWLRARILRRAKAKLPSEVRERFSHEWDADISAQPGEIAKLTWSIGCYFSAGEICAVSGARVVRVNSASIVDWLAPAVASFTLLICAPTILIVVLCLTTTGPVFIHKPSLGKDLNKFLRYRFRTFNIGEISRSDPRRSPFGRVLRRLGLDELPVFFNLLRGDMTLVGPRVRTDLELKMLRADEREIYRRLKPGIVSPTVLLDANEENLEPFEFEYFVNRTTLTDLRVLIRAALVAFFLDARRPR